MNNLSEEEIIKYIKDEIENETDTYHWFDDMPDNKTRKQIEESINAHKGLLDLYNKEKEKNKELENADLTTVYMDGFYDGEKKWKYKIRDKIKAIEKETWYLSDGFDARQSCIEELQELLEEKWIN